MFKSKTPRNIKIINSKLKAPNAGLNQSKESKINFLSKIGTFMDTIFRILYYPFKQIDANYQIILKVLYIIRGLFALFAILVMIVTGFFYNLPQKTLYHLYSFLKTVFVIFMIFSSIFIVVFTIKDEEYRIDADTQTELSVLYSCLRLLPYMYDLTAFIIILGIIKAYYIRSCGSNNPNVWFTISIIIWIPVTFIILRMMWSIVIRLLKLNNTNENDKIKVYLNQLMSVSFAFLILYFAMQYIEGIIANNISYWMLLKDKNNSDEGDCVNDGLGTKGDADWEKAKNVMISILLGTLLLLILIVQLIPLFGLDFVNEALRNILKISTNKAVNSLGGSNN